ncbi:uncharacterized protein PG998_009591 [Apiospora kogelbergensis]|uniref:Uncharacterized protein n=1 Tax=Apiospora kogelbergensis TaxID=1337665 RepID=A0AAW0R8A4_9PEZI
MAPQNNIPGSSEVPCPAWVHDASILVNDLTHHMVDQIQCLRTIDGKYQLKKPWLSNQMSIQERVEVILQHMEYKPWFSDTEEDFQLRLDSCVREDFLVTHKTKVRNLASIFVTNLPGINDEKSGAEEFHMILRFRAYTKAVLVSVLLSYSGHHQAHRKDEKRPDNADTMVRNRDSASRKQPSTPRNHASASTGTTTTNQNNGNVRMCMPGSWPSGPPMGSESVQQSRQWQQVDTVGSRPIRVNEIRRKPLPSSLGTNSNNRPSCIQQSYPLEALMDSQPVQQLREQIKQLEHQADVTCCSREQEDTVGGQPTGKSWPEQHGVTATVELRNEKRAIGISRGQRVARKVSKWIFSPVNSQFRTRRGGS